MAAYDTGNFCFGSGSAYKMNIAFFSKQLPSDAPNGVSCQVHRLANALVEFGDTVTCYSFSPAPMDALYRHVRLSYWSSSPLLRKIIPALLFRKIPAGDHDILHYHGDDFLCKGRRCRVRTFYGSAFFEAYHAATFKRSIYQSLFYMFEWISCLRRGEKAGISRITVRALPLIANVVYCGVPARRYTPGSFKTGDPSLLFIGDLDSRKRGRLLVETFSRTIRPAFPNALLTVIGPQKENDGGGVRYAGRISEDALVEEYQKSWMYCSVSSYEGFGVPLIEAMACGTAIVAIDNGGAREILTHEYDGLLCSERTLAKTIERLISDAELRSRLIANGIKTAQKFDISISARRYRELYEACRGGR